MMCQLHLTENTLDVRAFCLQWSVRVSEGGKVVLCGVLLLGVFKV